MPEISPLRPGVWIVDSDLGDFQVRGAVIAGEKRVVVWDTLARPGDMAGVGDLAPDLPLSVVYSHGDWDHVWGTCGLSRDPLEIVAHEACSRRFAVELPLTLDEKRIEAPKAYEKVELVPPTRTFRIETTLGLGGASLQLHHLPGHTLDSVVGYIPETGIFLAGDAVETPFPYLNPETPIQGWADSLEDWYHRLEAAPVTPLVIPSHGRLGGPELLQENARYIRDLLDGNQPSIPENLSPFYQEAHAQNQALALRLP